jgi:hypothetical protein
VLTSDFEAHEIESTQRRAKTSVGLLDPEILPEPTYLGTNYRVVRVALEDLLADSAALLRHSG